MPITATPASSSVNWEQIDFPTGGDTVPNNAKPVLTTPKSGENLGKSRPGANGGGRLLSGNRKENRKPRTGIGRGQTGEEREADRAAFTELVENKKSDYLARMVVRLKLLVWAVENTKQTADRYVLLYLIYCTGHSPNDGNYLMSWPSQKRIAEETGINQRTVRRAIMRLRSRGLIGVTYRYGAAGTKMAGRRLGAKYTLYVGQLFPNGWPVGEKGQSEQVAGRCEAITERVAGRYEAKSEKVAPQYLLNLKSISAKFAKPAARPETHKSKKQKNTHTVPSDITQSRDSGTRNNEQRNGDVHRNASTNNGKSPGGPYVKPAEGWAYVMSKLEF